MALQIGAKTGLPVFHLDQIFWMPNWAQRPEAEKLARVAEIEAKDSWVIEGVISETFPNRMARCDMLIWLDLPLSLRLWRVIRRTFHYRGRSRPDMPVDCVQRFDAKTMSFLKFLWQDHRAAQQRMVDSISAHGQGVKLYHLQSLREVRAFVQGFEAL
ncbi:IstB domain protein ATP-binding protein [Sulfitobacter donghicola DSW-25 = KCTC 12864 = JCM 14565]|nr:IstB domain protein ATP-binding protein [Sulfitobacter donghicola DSW-25 = KCTC 12864 = JCM 14565]